MRPLGNAPTIPPTMPLAMAGSADGWICGICGRPGRATAPASIKGTAKTAPSRAPASPVIFTAARVGAAGAGAGAGGGAAGGGGGGGGAAWVALGAGAMSSFLLQPRNTRAGTTATTRGATAKVPVRGRELPRVVFMAAECNLSTPPESRHREWRCWGSRRKVLKRLPPWRRVPTAKGRRALPSCQWSENRDLRRLDSAASPDWEHSRRTLCRSRSRGPSARSGQSVPRTMPSKFAKRCSPTRARPLTRC